ncbi:MAG: hypothetical protein ACU0BS_04485 [Hasllibacter sp.]
MPSAHRRFQDAVAAGEGAEPSASAAAAGRAVFARWAEAGRWDDLIACYHEGRDAGTAGEWAPGKPSHRLLDHADPARLDALWHGGVARRLARLGTARKNHAALRGEIAARGVDMPRAPEADRGTIPHAPLGDDAPRARRDRVLGRSHALPG